MQGAIQVLGFTFYLVDGKMILLRSTVNFGDVLQSNIIGLI